VLRPGLAAGQGPVSLAIPGAPAAGFGVCYEAIFPDRFVDPLKRPGWLINVTNDGWFGDSTGPYQHLAQARLRTIEQGLPMVRAANTGISAVIDPYGRILSSLPLSAAFWTGSAARPGAHIFCRLRRINPGPDAFALVRLGLRIMMQSGVEYVQNGGYPGVFRWY
jgi:apolipoprotein N-acyltransferase